MPTCAVRVWNNLDGEQMTAELTYIGSNGDSLSLQDGGNSALWISTVIHQEPLWSHPPLEQSHLTAQKGPHLTAQWERAVSGIALPHFPSCLGCFHAGLSGLTLYIPPDRFSEAAAVFPSPVALLHPILLLLHSISATLYVSAAIFPSTWSSLKFLKCFEFIRLVP